MIHIAHAVDPIIRTFQACGYTSDTIKIHLQTSLLIKDVHGRKGMNRGADASCLKQGKFLKLCSHDLPRENLLFGFTRGAKRKNSGDH